MKCPVFRPYRLIFSLFGLLFYSGGLVSHTTISATPVVHAAASDGLVIDLLPDKSFYRPGEPVRLTVTVSPAVEGRIHARVSYLAEQVAILEAPIIDGVADLEWTPPPISPRGYGVDVTLLDAEGQTLAETSSAFDVLERWTQAPRYGFLTEFTPQRHDPDATMEWAARYHLNGLQFYDWQYRHEQLLPPEGSDVYSDLLGRSMSLNTVKALIDAAHRHNIAAMPYTAIYGASASFYREHPDWALFSTPDKPYTFGDNYLIIMNPTPGTPWATHLLDQFAQVLDSTAFDGIHIDQYGAPLRGRDSDNQLVRLDEAFPAFVNAAAALVDEKRGEDGAVIFNLVRNWPLETVAPSDQDAVYIEVWEPYRSLLDLYRIVEQAQRLSGGKPVIIAAYISPEHEVNVRLMNALIVGAGGYHLELGEPETMLADPYFPKFGMMSDGLQAVMRRYYDFAVRYENVLSLASRDVTAERASALKIANIPTQGTRSRDRVAVIVRESETHEAFNLVNLMGIGGERWDEPLPNAPEVRYGLTVQVKVERPLTAVYFASPDGDDLSPQPVDFTMKNDVVTFELPQLVYWTTVILEYAR